MQDHPFINYQQFFPNARQEELRTLLTDKNQWVMQDKKGFLRYRRPFESVRHLRATCLDFGSDIVTIGTAEDCTPNELAQVNTVLRTFMPWRKGPFSVFGIDIDAEWRSERKWNRITPKLPSLRGKVIADIGCNNGYYMFRMAKQNPAMVLGFEPYVHHYYAFQTLNNFAGQGNLESTLLGIEQLELFPESFDIIFCLGILYHRSSPLDSLRDIYQALKPGGVLVLESQAIPGDDPVALFPERTYAKVPGTWFVPTASCLQNWLLRTGFTDIDFFCSHPMSSKEQRRTDWMNFESYEDFIDKENPELTIEGYSAPWRVFFNAVRH